MRVRKLHDDEADVDEPLIRDLLTAQMPQWAALPLRPVDPVGTDNVIVRLGSRLAVRLPRTPGAARNVAKEQGLVPHLAERLPYPVPVPVGVGEPGAGYPFPWTVHAWIPGTNPEPGTASVAVAEQLVRFVTALHGIGTSGYRRAGALDHYRAASIQLRDEQTRLCLAQCADLLDTSLVGEVWDVARRVPDHSGDHVWMHSDLHPGNLLTDDGRLAAVIDWGGLALGDPAVDCLVAWTYLGPGTRAAFRAGVGVDDGTWRRGRAWALSIALVALPYYRNSDARITAWSRYAIDQVVTDVTARG